jgi:hypothetical protein
VNIEATEDEDMGAEIEPILKGFAGLYSSRQDEEEDKDRG